MKTIHSEVSLTSDILGIGCTVDWIGENKGRAWLLDWKTGELYREQKCQVATYAFLAMENLLLDGWPNLGVVQAHRDGKPVVVKKVIDPISSLKAALNQFQRWKWDNEEKLKWVMAPEDFYEKRKKSRGKNREKYNKLWKAEYAWPWLYRDAVKDAMQFLGE